MFSRALALSAILALTQAVEIESESYYHQPTQSHSYGYQSSQYGYGHVSTPVVHKPVQTHHHHVVKKPQPVHHVKVV